MLANTVYVSRYERVHVEKSHLGRAATAVAQLIAAISTPLQTSFGAPTTAIHNADSDVGMCTEVFTVLDVLLGDPVSGAMHLARRRRCHFDSIPCTDSSALMASSAAWRRQSRTHGSREEAPITC